VFVADISLNGFDHRSFKSRIGFAIEGQGIRLLGIEVIRHLDDEVSNGLIAFVGRIVNGVNGLAINRLIDHLDIGEGSARESFAIEFDLVKDVRFEIIDRLQFVDRGVADVFRKTVFDEDFGRIARGTGHVISVAIHG